MERGRLSRGVRFSFLDAAESAATSTAIAATGGAGLVAAGLTTASDKYDELSRENPEMGETLKWANAIGTGAAESLSEVFGAGMMGRTVRNILQKSGREAAANLVKKNFLDKIASFEGKHWFAMPIASEGLEEAGNALASYAIDRLTGVERNDNIFKTMLDAGVAGSMGGAQFSPFIGAAKDIVLIKNGRSRIDIKNLQLSPGKSCMKMWKSSMTRSLID